jgi:glutathione S-transferase
VVIDRLAQRSTRRYPAKVRTAHETSTPSSARSRRSSATRSESQGVWQDAAMKIVLHQWEMSPFCNKVRRVLTAKGLEFDAVNYNGLQARKAARLSSAGTLPVMDYGEARVQDSAAIVRFLEEKHPAPALIPADAEARASAHVWEDWAAQSLYFFEIYFRMLVPEARERALDLITKGRPAYEKPIVRAVLKRRYPRKLRAQGLGRLPAEEVERQWFTHVDALDAILAKRRWLAGDALSIGDVSVAAQLDEVLRTSDLAGKIRERRHVIAWLERM